MICSVFEMAIQASKIQGRDRLCLAHPLLGGKMRKLSGSHSSHPSHRLKNVKTCLAGFTFLWTTLHEPVVWRFGSAQARRSDFSFSEVQVAVNLAFRILALLKSTSILGLLNIHGLSITETGCCPFPWGSTSKLWKYINSYQGRRIYKLNASLFFIIQ